MDKPAAIKASSLYDQIRAALDIGTDLIRRIVIDLPFDGVATVYIEMLADERMLRVDWGTIMPDVAVVTQGNLPLSVIEQAKWRESEHG